MVARRTDGSNNGSNTFSVFQFIKYGEIPVCEYSGTPYISIPAYTINKGDINLHITLRYHASGIWFSFSWFSFPAESSLARPCKMRGNIYPNAEEVN